MMRRDDGVSVRANTSNSAESARTHALPEETTVGEFRGAISIRQGLENVSRALRRHGAAYVLRQLALWLAYPLWSSRPSLIGRPSTFTFGGEVLHYFYHRYNLTWSNERSVEIPVVLDAIHRIAPARMLEVGNVLAHYGHRGHDVIDKYELARGVINQDVVDFRPECPYELIVSISTLEHVGWDEQPRDAGKIPRAVANLRRCLAPGGRLVITVPLGYNTDLDALLANGALDFSDVRYLRRARNGWTEATWDEVRGAAMDDPYRGVNAIIVGTFTSLVDR
jgi:hypothetical protein